MALSLRWLLFVPLLVAPSACSKAESATLDFAPPTATTESAGVVRVDKASRPYVTITKAEQHTTDGEIHAPAHVAFKDGVVSQIGAPIGGRVTDVSVHVGDKVVKGAPLVTLSSPDAAAARAALAAAEVTYDTAQKEGARQQSMMTSGVGIASEQVAADGRLREASAELARARVACAYLGGGSGPTVIIRAPIDGTVLTRHATTGAYAAPGADPLVEIGDPQAVWMVAEVFEWQLAAVKPGAEVTLSVGGFDASTVKGHVASVGSVVTAGLRTAPVYISLDAAVPGIHPGMTAQVTITADGTATKAVVLPVDAVLIKDGDRHVVYVQVGEDTFAAKDVKVSPVIDGRVQVTGLDPGAPVVTKGALLLDGAAEQLL